MGARSPNWNAEADVVVVGTGAAGLAAAVAARIHGARVLLLECSGKVGGATAVSIGGVWIPLNQTVPDGDHPGHAVTSSLAACRG